MFKDEVLVNERRRKMYSFIQANPGVYLREIQRFLSIPIASVEYHLSYMTRNRVILQDKGTHYTRYYCSLLDADDKRMLVVLRQKNLRDIVLIILRNEKVKYHFLIDYLKLPCSTISLHLRHLLDERIIERTKVGYENFYTVKDVERITKIFKMYQNRFLDTVVSRATATWVDFRVGKEKTEEAPE